MHVERLKRSSEGALLFLLAFAVLWKGGKSLEVTWLLTAVVWGMVLTAWWMERMGGGERGTQEDVPGLLWWSVVGFAAWTALSFVTSRTQNYGLDEVLRDSSLVLLLPTIVRRARREGAFGQRLLTVFAVAACVAAFIGILIYILQPVSRAVGTFFDHRFHTDYWPNAWAEFVLLGWPVVLWWALQPVQGHSTRDHMNGRSAQRFDHERAERVEWWALGATSRQRRLLRFTLLGVLLGGLLLSYSRGALVAFVGQLALGGVLLLVRTRPSTMLRVNSGVLLGADTRAAALRGCGIVIIAILTFLAVNAARSQFFEVESIARKATFSAAEGRSSVSERSRFWAQALSLSKERTLLGQGPYSFRFLQPRLQEDVYATSDHAHSVVLKLAMERGWPAAILFGILVGFILLRAFALVRRAASPHAFLAGTLLLSITGVLAHNLVDYNLQFVGIVLPLWLLLGVLESLQAPRPLLGFERRLRRGVEVAFLSALVLVAISEGRLLVLSSLGRHAESRGDTATALQWYAASERSIFSRDLHLSRAGLLMRGGHLDAATDALDQYFRQNAEDARAWKMRGDLLRLQGEHARALAAYEEAYVRGKQNYLSILEGMLLTWRALKDTETVAEREEEIMSLLRRYSEAIQQNVHFIALSDNVETFLRISVLLKDFTPKREAELTVLSAGVDRHAKEERAKLAAHRPGMLW